ncbi:TIGR04149 family rSAM-modified RiPP [Prevotella lacticifex]|uniref:TIGR04149 family rSAM-modified RiPP n=1 Tax=Prevotella lacticifex TaxID=2854755 RepID=UPI001CC4A946
MSLKITELTKSVLSRRELSSVRGGETASYCTCGCKGNSNTIDNGCANSAHGLYSPGGGSIFLKDVVVIAKR